MAYKYPSFWDRHFGEHVALNTKWFSVVIFGFNAMHVALNIRVFGWWWCFHPPMRVFGKWWPWYFYASRDATPYNCLFHFGKRT
jgi:hypothetical protein